MGTLHDILPPLITGIIALIAGWLVAKTNKPGVREINLVNELQEEVDKLRERIDKQDDKIKNLEKDNLDKSVYISELKQYIIEKKEPPPPEIRT